MSDSESIAGKIEMFASGKDAVEKYDEEDDVTSNYFTEDEDEDEDNENRHQLRWTLKAFKMHNRKRKKQYPVALKKVSMERRRPIWLAEQNADTNLFEQISYFSEISAVEQFKNQAAFRSYYKSKFGPYRTCYGFQFNKSFQPKTLKGVYSVRISPEGNYLAIGTGAGVIKVFSTEKRRTFVMKLKGPADSISSIKFHPKLTDTFFAAGLSGIIYLGRLEEKWNCYKYAKEIRTEVNVLDVSTSGSIMATGGKDAAVRIYDVEKYKVTEIFPALQCGIPEFADEFGPGGHCLRIFALKFVPDDDNIFLTGGWDNIVKVWDRRVAVVPVMNMYGPHVCGESIDIVENSVLVGQWTSHEGIQLWDLRRGKVVQTVAPENRSIHYRGEFVYCAQFMGPFHQPTDTLGDLILVGGSGSGAVEVISIRENIVLCTYPEPKPVVSVHHYGTTLVFGTPGHSYTMGYFTPSLGEDLTEPTPEENIEEEELDQESTLEGQLEALKRKYGTGKDLLECFKSHLESSIITAGFNRNKLVELIREKGLKLDPTSTQNFPTYTYDMTGKEQSEDEEDSDEDIEEDEYNMYTR